MRKSIIIFLLFVVIKSTIAAEQLGTINVKISPNTASIYVNAEEAGKGEINSYKVPSGPNMILIKDDNFCTKDTAITITANEEKSINIVLDPLPSTIDVITEPLGATVILNKEEVGKTPYSEKKFKPGHYLMRLKLYGYELIEETFYLPPNDAAEFTYELKHTQAYLDSVKVAKIARKKRNRFIRKIAFGSAAVAFAATGVFFNSRMQNEINGYNQAAEDYDKTADNFSRYKDDYYMHRDNAKKESNRRNIAYGISTACVLGFSISFLF